MACASSDGKVSVLTFKGTSLARSHENHIVLNSSVSSNADDGTWDAPLFVAHPIGCNAVSWAPAIQPASLTSASLPQNSPLEPKKFATGGCDGLVKIWALNSHTHVWELSETLEGGHTDWIRDLAYSPNIGLSRTYLASAGQDQLVNVWTQDGPKSPWVQHTLDPSNGGSNPTTGNHQKFGSPVWRVSWSLGGNVLAVCVGDGKISLWKENLKGRWVRKLFLIIQVFTKMYNQLTNLFVLLCRNACRRCSSEIVYCDYPLGIWMCVCDVISESVRWQSLTKSKKRCWRAVTINPKTMWIFLRFAVLCFVFFYST